MLRRLPVLAVSSLLVVCLSAPVATAQRRPVVERVEPTAGPVGGEVELVGRDFPPDTRVFLGDVELPVVRRAPSRWTLRVPEGARTGRMVLRTAAGTYRGPDFRVAEAGPAPVVERLEPTQGPPGVEVTIVGQNFSPRLVENRVLLAGRPVVVRSASPTALVVVVPEGASGEGRFEVIVQRSAPATSGPFRFTAPTAITSFEPKVGPAGTRVTLRGAGFSAVARENRVYLNAVAMRVVAASETELQVVLSGRVATGVIKVDVQGAGRAETSEPFWVAQPATIRSVRPSSAPPGGRVTLTGTHFGDDPRLIDARVSGVALTPRSVTPTALELELPDNARSGAIELSVRGLAALHKPELTVLTPTAVAAFAPMTGPAGTIVTIRGSGFAARPTDNQVRLGDVRAQVVGASPTELRVRIPGGPSAPLVVEPRDNRAATTTTPFVVTMPPFVTGFEPASVRPGGEVTIRGQRFGSDRSVVEVTAGDQPLVVTTVTPTTIAATVPEDAVGGPVRVTVRLQGTSVTQRSLEVITPLHVASFHPPQVFEGAELVIRGRGFTSSARVRLHGVTAPVRPRSITPGELRVIVPRGTTTGIVTVEQGGGATASGPQALDIVPVPTGLAVQAFTAACMRAGCDVTLVGHGFGATAAANRVTFEGRPVRVREVAANRLVVTLPEARGPGRFRVVVRGRGEATSPPLTIE